MPKIIKKEIEANEPAKPARKSTARPVKLETAGFRTVGKTWEIVLSYEEFLNLSNDPLAEIPTRNGSVIVRLFTSTDGIRVVIPHHKIS